MPRSAEGPPHTRPTFNTLPFSFAFSITPPPTTATTWLERKRLIELAGEEERERERESVRRRRSEGILENKERGVRVNWVWICIELNILCYNTKPWCLPTPRVQAQEHLASAGLAGMPEIMVFKN